MTEPTPVPETSPETGPVITIVHTRQHGTVVYGTTRRDGSGAIFNRHRFRGSENLEVPHDEDLGYPYWYMPHSQRSSADRYYIDIAAEELRAAGWIVDIRIDDTTPAEGFWIKEHRKYAHATYRAERLAVRAGTAASTSAAIRDANRNTYDALAGSPILIGHHSENRHRNLLDRLWKREGKAWELYDTANRLLERASAARDFQDRREALGTTLRRIKKLHKRLRDIDKKMAGRTEWWCLDPLDPGHPSERDTNVELLTNRGIPFTTGTVRNGCVQVRIGVSEHGQAVLAADVVETLEEIAYWEDLITASGQKVWTAADFTPGDFAKVGSRWMEVVKAGKATLTVPDPHEHNLDDLQTMAALAARVRHPHTGTVPYDEIGGKLTAEEARVHHPAAFAEHLEGEEPPTRTRLKHGKVKLTLMGGAQHQVWTFTINGQDYSASWPEPDHDIWYGPPTPLTDPGPIRVVKTFGLTSRPPELVTELSVPIGIRWREDVANVLRTWVDAFAVNEAT